MRCPRVQEPHEVLFGLGVGLDQTACTEIVGFRKGGEVHFSSLGVQELG